MAVGRKDGMREDGLGEFFALPRVLCIVGPTSSGKTALSLRLAKRYNGEIINADACQVYRQLTIGTGKPTGKWGPLDEGQAYFVESIPHHLMDVLDPLEKLTVAEWRERAVVCIRQILKRGHVPIVVGGTGLYIKALVDNLDFPKVAPQAELRAELEKKSLAELVELLIEKDPEGAKIVDLKNPRRVIRALEVCYATGNTFSELQKTRPAEFTFLQIGIQHTREELYQRIETEVDHMIERGWIDEIRSLMQAGIPADAPAMSAIGYQELRDFVEGKRSFDEAVRACKQAVRNYAKRQETWFKKDQRIQWLVAEADIEVIVDRFLSL